MPDSGALSLTQDDTIERATSCVAACLARAVPALAYCARLLLVLGPKPIRLASAAARDVVAPARTLV